MSNELKEALAEVDAEADRIAESLRDLRTELKKARAFEDDWDDLQDENKSLKDEIANLTDENNDLEGQLGVLKKNLPEVERELMLWRLQRK